MCLGMHMRPGDAPNPTSVVLCPCFLSPTPESLNTPTLESLNTHTLESLNTPTLESLNTPTHDSKWSSASEPGQNVACLL